MCGGNTPRSVSSVALTMIMNRIVVSPGSPGVRGSLPAAVARAEPDLGREVGGLVDLPDLALAAAEHLEETARPLDRRLLRLDLEHRVRGDQLLRLRERAVGHRARAVLQLDARAPGARMQAVRRHQHAGPGD